MLDLKQFINQTLSLPLGSHRNMVGGLILGLSIVTASKGDNVDLESREKEMPFPLYQGATIKCANDVRPPHTVTLAQELQSKKIAKLLKKQK